MAGDTKISGLTEDTDPTSDDNLVGVDDIGGTPGNKRIQIGNIHKGMNASTGVSSGTTNPVSPATNDRFFRTDLGFMIFFDGTRWLTMHTYTHNRQRLALSATDISNELRGSLPRIDYVPFIVRIAVWTRVVTTNDGTDFWTILIEGQNLAQSSQTTVLSFLTSSDTVNVYTRHDATPSDSTPSNNDHFNLSLTKNNTPGNLDIDLQLEYRLIVT